MLSGKTVFRVCLFVLMASIAAQAAETSAPAVASAAPPLQLGCAGRQKVVEASKEIEMLYALTVPPDKSATILKPSAPLAWKVTDASGKVIVEVAAAKPAGPVKLDGKSSTTAGVYASEKIKPQEKWPLGVLRVEGTYAVTQDMYKAAGCDAADAFTGIVTSKPVEIVVKTDGWKEATYKRYVDALHRMLRKKLQSMAYEFPEARQLDNVTIAPAADAVIGQFKLVREMLDVDSKQKTARLKKYEGILEFAARDPWAQHDLAPDVKGLAEDGLLSIEFRYEMNTNPAFARRLIPVEEEILKQLQQKGPAAADGIGLEPSLAMPAPTMPSTEEMLLSAPPAMPKGE